MSIKVGITMRVVNALSYNEPRDAISHDWVDLLLANNLEFVLIPNCGDKVNDFLELNKIQAIILSNGNDIDDENVKVPLEDVSKRRDLTEHRILRWTRDNNINTLGVCRGLQLINVIYGGNIEYGLGKDHVGEIHRVEIYDSLTQKHFNTNSFVTNSFHNQGIRTENLAEGLIPFAIADDGVIEGFYVRDEPILAIQWHPERKLDDNFFNNQMPINFLINGAWWLEKNK